MTGPLQKDWDRDYESDGCESNPPLCRAVDQGGEARRWPRPTAAGHHPYPRSSGILGDGLERQGPDEMDLVAQIGHPSQASFMVISFAVETFTILHLAKAVHAQYP